jgi:hypothetical protein
MTSWHIALRSAALSALVVLATATAAHAEDFFAIEVPDALPASGPLANSIARDVSRTPYFGDRPADSGADAYAAQGQAALYVWWAVGEPTGDAAEAIRAAFDRLRQAPFESSPQARSVTIDTWEEHLEGNVAKVAFSWRHLSNETLTLSRALAFADPE